MIFRGLQKINRGGTWNFIRKLVVLDIYTCI